ncbi:MAG TPA: hypothetical protein V6C78_14615 [Crinalium sp.]
MLCLLVAIAFYFVRYPRSNAHETQYQVSLQGSVSAPIQLAFRRMGTQGFAHPTW